MRTDRRPAVATVTCTTNLVKFGRVVFELYERTDRQTVIFITILRTPLGAEKLIQIDI